MFKKGFLYCIVDLINFRFLFHSYKGVQVNQHNCKNFLFIVKSLNGATGGKQCVVILYNHFVKIMHHKMSFLCSRDLRKMFKTSV